MAMQIIVARQRAAENGKDVRVVLTAHLDTTKLLGDGTPDPAWCYVEELQVPGRSRTGETAGQFRTRLDAWMAATKPEFRTRCRARLDQLVDAAGAGTSLSVEGQAL